MVYGIGGELLAEYRAGEDSQKPYREYGHRGKDLLVTADGRNLRWLVPDHLGAPRMIADASGSLAGIERHDYLPFGEEVGAGIGVRSESSGYGGDTVRQKFTGKERDPETDLDWFSPGLAPARRPPSERPPG